MKSTWMHNGSEIIVLVREAGPVLKVQCPPSLSNKTENVSSTIALLTLLA